MPHPIGHTVQLQAEACMDLGRGDQGKGFVRSGAEQDTGTSCVPLRTNMAPANWPPRYCIVQAS